MKTATLSALLVLGLLATAAPALALPDPIVDCVVDATDGDGRRDRVGNAWVNADVLDQNGWDACN